jgi:hypothetical protein
LQGHQSSNPLEKKKTRFAEWNRVQSGKLHISGEALLSKLRLAIFGLPSTGGSGVSA